MTDAASDPGVLPPPAAAARDALTCPMCEYSLRGLAEPRCPECGYRFAWADLLDASRRPHPYLFEQHPERNVWSFVRTLVGTLRPEGFWSKLHAGQRSSPRRLLAYWVLATVLPILGALAGLLTSFCVRAEAVLDSARRAAAAASVWASVVNQRFPRPPSRAFLGIVLNSDLARASAIVAAVLVAWPWATCLTLMIFRMSMRRARVRVAHVCRCAIYASDVAFWVGLPLAVFLPLYGFWARDEIKRGGQSFWVRYVPGVPGKLTIDAGGPLLEAGHMLIACLLFAFSWRMAVAYRKYLRFDRAAVTVLSSQVILALFFVCLAVNVPSPIRPFWRGLLASLYLR